MNYREYCGWIFDPKAIEVSLNQLRLPVFQDSGAGLKGTGANKDIFLWEAEEKILGRSLQSYAQGIGDCVGNGWARGCQDSILNNILLGDLEIIPDDTLNLLKANGNGRSGFVSCEIIYAGSRCEIGGWWGQNSDGSIGSYAARWVEKYGVILRKNYPNILDLTTYSAKVAKTLGAKGCPDGLEPIAKEHPCTVSQVKSYEECRDALANYYPVPVASSQGFSMSRNSDGSCTARGTWMHQMVFRGHCIRKGNKPGVICQNSWGDYLNGPMKITLESGKEITIPEGAFIVEPEIVTRMCKQGDTYAISSFQGFPARFTPPFLF